MRASSVCVRCEKKNFSTIFHSVPTPTHPSTYPSIYVLPFNNSNSSQSDFFLSLRGNKVPLLYLAIRRAFCKCSLATHYITAVPCLDRSCKWRKYVIIPLNILKKRFFFNTKQWTAINYRFLIPLNSPRFSSRPLYSFTINLLHYYLHMKHKTFFLSFSPFVTFSHTHTRSLTFILIMKRINYD
jgi:hypothetical protein